MPGSSAVGPVVYVDALLAGMPPDRADGRSRRDRRARGRCRGGADALAEHERTPEFAFVRALAIEAFYSDFVAPGKDAPGAWAEIDFNSPLATRLHKDWSYLGIA